MQMLEQLKQEHPTLPVVIMSGHGNIETAVQAIKLGAYDFIEKPFKADRMILVVRRAIEAARLRRENEELRLRAGGEPGADRPVVADQSVAPGDRSGGADQQPGADHRSGRLRQGGGRPADPRPVAPRQRAVRRSQLRVDGAGADGDRAVRRRGRRRRCDRRRARSGPSKRRTTARCCSTRSPTCRRRRRARSSAFCRNRPSSGSAAKPALRSTSA